MSSPAKKMNLSQAQAKTIPAAVKIAKPVIAMATPVERAEEIMCANEFMQMCSGNLKALAESGSTASRAARNMQTEILEICNAVFSEIADVSKEAVGCRTANDVIGLYDKAMREAIDRYFDRASRLSDIFFNCCDEAMEPLNERASAASKHIRKSLAA
jgi:hypothetical protein